MRTFSYYLCFTFILLAASDALGALIPFSQNFNGFSANTDISPSGFTEVAGAGTTINYELNGTGLVFTSSSASGGASRSAAIDFTNAAFPTSFTMSTDFVLDSFASPSTSVVNLGLALFGSISNFSSGTQYRVLYTPSTSGQRLTISEVSGGSTVGATAQSAGTLAPTTGLAGNISVTASYIGSTLNLDATLVSGATTLTTSFSDMTPLTGQFFGYRTAINAAGGTASENVTYDNFNIAAIPEPTTWGVFGCFAIAVLAWRRPR